MKPRIGRAELDRAFHVFDKKAEWQWPFLGDDLVGAVFQLGCSAFLLAIVIGIFTHFPITGKNLAILAAAILIYRTIRLNASFIANASLRRKYERRYIALVEHTDAYVLLQEALAQRRRGVIKGLGTKKETERALLRLWRLAFAEANQLAVPAGAGAGALVGDPLEERPVSEQIDGYFRARAAAYEELDGVQSEINQGL